jgi:hypothetical protein
MDSPFYSAMAKLERAQLHVEALYTEAQRLMSDQVGRRESPFIKHFDPQLSAIVYTVADSVVLPSLAPPLGDALTNFRAALDHMAWALYQLGARPPGVKAFDIEFPICQSEPDFNGRSKTKLAGVDVEAVTIIGRYQPYVRGDTADAHPLAILNRLVRIDKHRDLHVMYATPFELRGEVTETRNFTPTHFEPLNLDANGHLLPFHPGTEILRVHGTPGPAELGEPNVVVKFVGPHGICLEDGTMVSKSMELIHSIILLIFYELAPIIDRSV